MHKTPGDDPRIQDWVGVDGEWFFRTSQRLENVFAGHDTSCGLPHEWAQIGLGALLDNLLFVDTLQGRQSHTPIRICLGNAF